MAQVLDNLKRAQKQQEDYNKQIEKASDYMKTLRENARFDIKYPNASELQKFDRYVKDNAASFRELKLEIEATRAALESKAFIAGFKTFDEATKTAFKGLDSVLAGFQKASALNESLKSFASNLNIVDGIKRSASESAAGGFAGEIESLFNAYEEKTKRLNDLLDTNTEKTEENKQTVIEATQSQQNAYRQLYDYLQKINVQTAGSGIQSLFKDVRSGQGDAAEFIAKLKAIADAVNADKLTKGLTTLDELFEKLNLRIGDVGAKTELEKLNQLLSDPNITEAIKQRADALGYTVEQLKELIRLKAENDADPRSTGTRPRVVEDENSGSGFLDEFKAGFEFLTDDKFNAAFASASGTLTAFGGLAGQVLNNMTVAVGKSIEQWALYGGSVGKALKQALAAELAHVAGVATINALYATALGFIRLAELNFPAAGWAFLSAGLWAALAGGSALAARALSDKNKAAENANYQQVSGGGQRDSKSGAGAYSSFGDNVKTYDAGAINQPEQNINVSVTVKTDRDAVVEIIGHEITRDRSPMGDVILGHIEKAQLHGRI